MDEWVRVEDRLPEPHQPVICFRESNPRGRFDMVVLEYLAEDDCNHEAGFYAGDETPFRISCDEPVSNVTHWMTLPGAPTRSINSDDSEKWVDKSF